MSKKIINTTEAQARKGVVALDLNEMSEISGGGLQQVNRSNVLELVDRIEANSIRAEGLSDLAWSES